MWNEKKVKEVYAYWQSCGLSIPAFCSNEGISESRFYYWKNKLQHSLPLESTGEFIPITIDHPKERLLIYRSSILYQAPYQQECRIFSVK